MQRIARGDEHVRALVSVGDPRLELAAQVKESRAAFGRGRWCALGPGWGASLSGAKDRF